MPLGTVGYKAETLPTYDPAKAKQLLQQSGVPASQLTIDLYYPSNVVSPVHARSQEPGAGDRERPDQAVGFTVNLKTEDWRHRLRHRRHRRQAPDVHVRVDLRLGRRRRLPHVAWFGYLNGQPNPQFALRERRAERRHAEGPYGVDDRPGQPAAGARPRTSWPPTCRTVPLVNAKPPGAYNSKVHGFVAQGDVIEYFNTVWIQ